jgi:arylsulfatase A-like enzyme
MAVAPVTGPSHASMFSGSGPWDHGVLLNGVPLPGDRPLLAEVLRAHGWRTAAFVSAYVLDGELGFRRGFEVYDDDFAWPKGSGRLLGPRLLAMLGRRWSPDTVLERRGGDTVDAALAWLEGRPRASRGAPWFLWVHLFDPHGPYTPPPPWDTRYVHGDATDPADGSMAAIKELPPYMRASLEGITSAAWVKARYDGEISYADTQLGRLLAAIQTRGEQERTLVAVMGDHGESLGEHEAWFTHGDDVHETSVHVPFAMRLPGTLPAGAVITHPVEGSDLAPTVLSIVGIAPPSTMTGRDARVAGTAPLARSVCFDRAANRAARAAGAITAPRWRLASARGLTLRALVTEYDGSSQIWDLARDPAGTTIHVDGAGGTSEGAGTPGQADPQTPASEPVLLLDAARDVLRSGASVRSGEAQVSDEERAKLEALGYLDPLGEAPAPAVPASRAP